MHVRENSNVWLVQIAIITGRLADIRLSRSAHLDEACELIFKDSLVNVADVLRNLCDRLNRAIILNNAIADTLCPKPNGLKIVHEMFIHDLEST